jgi:hypothetical protein
MTDDLNIFCRLPIPFGADEVAYVVAGMADARPGEVIVQATDDNDYPDLRVAERSVGAAAGIEYRQDGQSYPWELLMKAAAKDLQDVLNG